MCGIVGFAGHAPIGDAVLARMGEALRHRGPDDVGTWLSSNGSVGFSHRRLSILDLSERGRQPMSDPTGRVHLSFNGEIYNYRELRRELEKTGAIFRTETDTEVVLAAYVKWNELFVEKLNGMFALSLFDERSGNLFLARDRAGEKPLFIWRTGWRTVFASELKAFFAFGGFPRRIDRDALEHYLAYGYVPGELCLLEGVRKLRPGYLVRHHVPSGEWIERPYWNLPEYVPTRDSAADLERELETLLEDAVRKQLVADVPVAVLLSGGIDSSLVTAMAARTRSRINTFTVTFPSHAAFDEAPYARLVAQHFGTNHTELVAEDASPDLLPRLARQFDEPIADSSMIPTYLVSALIREHATVALGGDGGDELFAGYPHYTFIRRLDMVRRGVPSPLRRAVARSARRLPAGVRGRTYLMGLSRDARHAVGDINVYFDAAYRRRLVTAPPDRDVTTPEDHRVDASEGAKTLLQAAQRADFRTYLVDDILVKIDRASMMTSLEMRAPLLDHRIIELAFGRVPDALKANLTERKILLRRLASRLLPKDLDLQRKQGFSIPLGAWFRGEWGRYLSDILRDAPPALLNREAVDDLITGQEQGVANAHRLYSLAMLELWRREYGVSI